MPQLPDHFTVPALAIIVPTYNEAGNVEVLVQSLQRVLDPISWEIIFVDDDSPDGTAQAVYKLSRRFPNIRCIHRIGRRGLASAVVEGCLATAADYIAIMDGDLQHDEALLPHMLARIQDDNLDLVIGSRYMDGGGTGNWNRPRRLMSRLATRLSYLVIKATLTDPMSGLFMIRRSTFANAVHLLSANGYKILLDILASSEKQLEVVELPYVFRSRVQGESKVDGLVLLEYLVLLLDKIFQGIVPYRFILYSAMGTIGIVVHMAVLYIATEVSSLSFEQGQIRATLIAMVFNYTLNNQLTYRDRRHRGRRFVQGLILYCAICSIGLISNISVADRVYAWSLDWMLAGCLGALISAVFNYTLATQYVWGSGRRNSHRPGGPGQRTLRKRRFL